MGDIDTDFLTQLLDELKNDQVLADMLAEVGAAIDQVLADIRSGPVELTHDV